MQGSDVRFFRWTGGRFGTLLTSLIAVLLINPIIGRGTVGAAVVDVLFTAVMFAALVAILGRRRVFVLGLFLAVPAMGGRWAYAIVGYEPLVFAGLGMSALFLAYIAGAILDAILRETEVTIDTIAGSICVYLLLGVLFAEAFEAIYIAWPAAFDLSSEVVVADTVEGRARGLDQFLYFSFVTLTTLGYGDMLPVGRLARTLAMLEAVLGQLYLAILVARLVGVYIAGLRSDSG
jgi:hypothetical protein